jgi:citrate lyase subunit beta/citryl-CoA lyase
MTSRLPPPTWRSLLFVPATSERFVAKAHTRGADALILDLEDSIPPAEKVAARAALRNAARIVAQGGADVCVRINRPLELAIPDIEAAVMPGIAALMIPKIMGPEHVQLLSEVVAVREAATGVPVGTTRFIGIVETAAAIPHLHAIAAADPRMASLSIGSEDFSTEIGAVPSADSLYVFNMMMIAATRAAGVLPMGSLARFSDFTDLEGYREGLRRSRQLGFACATCIHPAHVPIINEEYGVTAEEADRARRLIATFEEGVARGLGAIAFEGTMIDLPVVERARRLLARVRP